MNKYARIQTYRHIQYTCLHVCIYVQCIHTYVLHAYIDTDIHTYIHTYPQTYICSKTRTLLHNYIRKFLLDVL